MKKSEKKNQITTEMSKDGYFIFLLLLVAMAAYMSAGYLVGK